MQLHPNARTTPLTRLDIVRRLAEGEAVQEAARAFGVSETTVRKWRRRYEEEGPSGLLDRSSAPALVANRTAPRTERRILQRRAKRWLMRDIAKAVRRALSTVAAVLKRFGLNRLPRLNPPPPAPRYECSRPGELDQSPAVRGGKPNSITHF